jgi:formiminotetrahydrofolate cyclodeaminase
MSSFAHYDITRLVNELAARTPTPGGGAAAAVTAALGCAAGAMAARYTTGVKFGEVSEQARALAETLERAASDCLRLADDDAVAYADLTAARKAKDQAAIQRANARAITVPADLLAVCALHIDGLRNFLGMSNPHLVSDVKVAIHLLAGAGRAAWQTFIINQPANVLRQLAKAHLTTLDQGEAAALGRSATEDAPA